MKEISQIEERLYAKDGLRALGQEIGNEILRGGGRKEDCEGDERIRGIFEEVGRLTREVDGVKLRERELKGTIERARQHFERMKNGVGSMAPVLAPGLHPPVLQGAGHRPMGQLANLGGNGGRQANIAIGRYPTGHYQQQQELYRNQQHQYEQYSIGDYQAAPRMIGQQQYGIPQHALHPTGQHQYSQHQSEGHETQYTPSRDPSAKPARKKRVKELEMSSDKPSPPVRRSSRVRTKKVTYVESESDAFSRTPSPEKSDAADSTFSPTKQEILDRKVQMGRSSSLVDKIGDWQKSQMTRTLGEPLQQALPNYLAHVTSDTKSKAREWSVNRYDVDAKIPSQNCQAHAGQQWEVNRYEADLNIPPPRYQEVEPRNNDYNYLRQSFSSKANLAPCTPPRQTDSEPQKRRLPAPVPEETTTGPNKKRKMALTRNETFPSQTGLRPIPVLAPTAARKSVTVEQYVVESEQDEGTEEDVSMQDDDTPVLEGKNGDGGDGEETEEDSELSDIDWDVLEEGILAD